MKRMKGMAVAAAGSLLLWNGLSGVVSAAGEPELELLCFDADVPGEFWSWSLDDSERGMEVSPFLFQPETGGNEAQENELKPGAGETGTEIEPDTENVTETESESIDWDELIEDPEADAAWMEEGWEAVTEGESETEPLIVNPGEDTPGSGGGTGGNTGGTDGGGTGPGGGASGGETGPETPGDTLIPTWPVTGEEVEISGEGGYHKDQSGIHWLAPGGILSVRPGKGSGYSGGTSVQVWEDGEVTTSFERYDAGGAIVGRTEEFRTEYRVDKEAPQVEVSVSGAQENGGIYYSNGQVVVQAKARKDKGSGTKSAVCQVSQMGTMAEGTGAGGDASETGSRTTEYRLDPRDDGSFETGILLSKEGQYQIRAEAKDQVGNEAESGESYVVIDQQAPQLTVSGVEEGVSYAGRATISIRCRDTAYKAGSLKLSIQGDSGYQPRYERTETGGGASLTVEDFPYDGTADGDYSLTASAEDLAGNSVSQTISFRINRGGSVYGLDPSTSEKIRSYYHAQPFSVRFAETNRDASTGARALIYRNGQLMTLEENEEGFTRTADEWEEQKRADGTVIGLQRLRRYELAEKLFFEEGVYRVVLMTEDAAGNRSDTQSGSCEVTFAIDKAAPQILFSSVKSGEVIREDRVWIAADVRDNLKLKKAVLYLDGEEKAAYSGSELEENGNLLRVQLEKKDGWQRVQIYAVDEAGNEARSEWMLVHVAGKDESGRAREEELAALKEAQYQVRHGEYAEKMKERLHRYGEEAVAIKTSQKQELWLQ
ncbi:MAG: Ig-like domain-containing protein [Lachnospiraceae bacterium]|nr:Ig-like domain-containing protein [Lachnospiraceae bacterium]